MPLIGPQFNIKAIVKYCIKNKILVKCGNSTEYVWDNFLENPKDNKNHETAVFKPLDKIFSSIIDVAQKLQNEKTNCPAPISYLHSDGFTATWSEKNSQLKPDAHVFLEGTELGPMQEIGNRNWYNSAFVLHFKKSSKGEHDVSPTKSLFKDPIFIAYRT